MSSKSSEIWRGTRSDGRAPVAGTGVLWAVVIALLVVGAILWVAIA